MVKVALVTGSAKGIGKAIVSRLGAKGYYVFLHYFMNERAALELKESFGQKGYKCSVIGANLGDEKEIKNMYKKIEEEKGYLDLLVNNAATGVHKDMLEVRRKDWDWTFSVNGRGTFFTSVNAVKLMKNSPYERKNIINIISSGSNKYIPGYSLVGGSKAYIENMTKYLAVELANSNINVNAISSGLVDTDALNYFVDKKLVIDSYLEKCPQKKLIEPSEVADVVELLTSPFANRICGQTIYVDGGASIC
ncbi:SDR family oxidoreductase [Paraliobacillus sp. JSM ZJ581]|uniref:SDR family oxidoreductase n=1 Tax=Paraliobacillus sp. JSM ZJ581 TaxID=3342118 RepID=UPI0035A86190